MIQSLFYWAGNNVRLTCQQFCFREKLDPKTSQWTPLGHPTPTKLVVNNLETGKEYKFRVRAHNAEGESDFVESEPIVAKDKFDVPGKPENLRKQIL